LELGIPVTESMQEHGYDSREKKENYQDHKGGDQHYPEPLIPARQQEHFQARIQGSEQEQGNRQRLQDREQHFSPRVLELLGVPFANSFEGQAGGEGDQQEHKKPEKVHQILRKVERSPQGLRHVLNLLFPVDATKGLP